MHHVKESTLSGKTPPRTKEAVTSAAGPGYLWAQLARGFPGMAKLKGFRLLVLNWG